MAFKPVNSVRSEGETFDFDVAGDALEGYYAGARDIQTKNGPRIIHDFRTEDGVKNVFGSAVLNQELKTVELGTLTRITYTGMHDGKNGRSYRGYQVEVDEDATIDLSKAPITRAAPTASAIAARQVKS